MTQSPWLDAGGEDSFPELLWEDGERRFNGLELQQQLRECPNAS